MSKFAALLEARECTTQMLDDVLRVHVPTGHSQELLWEVAAANDEQIRYLRPQRSTLEEVFLNAVERS
jgi:ABC-2 type transport system ATP-binding protein